LRKLYYKNWPETVAGVLVVSEPNQYRHRRVTVQLSRRFCHKHQWFEDVGLVFEATGKGEVSICRSPDAASHLRCSGKRTRSMSATAHESLLACIGVEDISKRLRFYLTESPGDDIDMAFFGVSPVVRDGDPECDAADDDHIEAAVAQVEKLATAITKLAERVEEIRLRMELIESSNAAISAFMATTFRTWSR
jgi:hypothetical protein